MHAGYRLAHRSLATAALRVGRHAAEAAAYRYRKAVPVKPSTQPQETCADSENLSLGLADNR